MIMKAHPVRLVSWLALAAMLFCHPAARAAVIGTNGPAQPLTVNRIESLPEDERTVWAEYLQRSARQREADQNAFRAELRLHGVRKATVPPESRSRDAMRSDRPDEWYSRPLQRRAAENIVTFQTPSGGWSKNLDLTSRPRPAGMFYAPNNSSRFLAAADFDVPLNGWSYVGTFDNDATTMPLRFLARVISASGTNDTVALRASFVRGMEYIFASQYPNGGWPQVWPLDGGYHDAVTYNDNAIVNILNLLYDVVARTNYFAFVSESVRSRAATAFSAGLQCVLRSQVVSGGIRTAWPQQCDPLTLAPASARNFEMESLASSESAGLLRFLMRLPEPDSSVTEAIHSAAAWFEKTAIRDKAFRATGPQGRFLVSAPGNGPIWARYYEIGSNRPLFGDRDKSIHDRVDEISQERRAGYAWYTDGPEGVLKDYSRWKQGGGKKAKSG